MAKFVTGLSVGMLVLAYIGRLALQQFFAADTGSFDADSLLIWVVVPVIFLLVIVLYMLNKATAQT